MMIKTDNRIQSANLRAQKYNLSLGTPSPLDHLRVFILTSLCKLFGALYNRLDFRILL